ncbi:MAG: hypothetical protein HGA55_05900 [Methanoregulaceae archaeon]|nr:hypothetical protein [Methanoregulaceae archaeon]
MEERLKLKYDPLQVFTGSKAPAGLYARQKWRHEEDAESWAGDFRETVRSLRADQFANGSWGDSEVITMRRLFGLHLTVRDPDDSTNRALDWLLGKAAPSPSPAVPHGNPDTMHGDITNEIDEELLSGLPFSWGCFGHFVICAGLFLANCFGRGEEEQVTRLYDDVAREIEANNGVWCRIGCTNNALRAFVTHERYAGSRATAMMVDYLGRRQLSSGRWKGRTPFYMTFNALAHLDSAKARGQCMAAAESVVRAQNKDGSWGRRQKEWDTFLVVHALNRLKLLAPTGSERGRLTRLCRARG